MTDADRPAFLEAFGKLAIALRGHEPDAIQMQVYFEDLADLPIELVAAAARAIRRGGAESGWFPTVPDWRSAARAIERQRREDQRATLRRAGLPACRTCRDTGFVLDEAKNVVAPCACQGDRRAEILGRSELPALPPATDPKPDPSQMERVKAMVRPALKSMTPMSNLKREADRARWRDNVARAIEAHVGEAEASR